MKKQFLFSLFFCLSLPAIVFSQGKPNYVGQWYQRSAEGKTPAVADPFTPGTSDFPRTKKYNLNANINQLNFILQTKPALINIAMPFGGNIYMLNLAKVEITAGDFGVKTNNGNANPNKGVQYRGIVNNNPKHIASLSFTPDNISGLFSTDEGNFSISKDGLQFIIYNQNDVPAPQGIYCLTPDVTYQVNAPSAPVTGVGCKTVSVYLECDYAFFQNQGSNISNITGYVIGFFNQVATIYANENIAVQISEMFVWTSPDPHAGLTSITNVLDAFMASRGTGFNGNLAHFLTTRNLGGGVAYVNTLCNKAYAYGVSMVHNNYNNFPAYSWTVEVVTHELGHNIGSPHTHSCSWPGGALDNCYTPEGTCAIGPVPVNGGTIMSYCHTGSIGINFSNGFGPTPGNLIRDKVMSATCITGGTSSSPPGSLSSMNLTETGASLNWNASQGAVNYTVQYKLATAAGWTQGGTTTATSVNISGLTGLSNYVWTVRSDCSAFAANANFTTGGTTGCTAPVSLTNTNITQTGATLNWAAVTAAASYTVQYKTTAATAWTNVTVTTNSVVVSNLVSATNYTWMVKANCSPNSVQTSFTTGTSAYTCTLATNLFESNIISSAATLNWTGNANAQSYTVGFRQVGARNWTNYNVTGNTLKVKIRSRRSYEWMVDTKCANGTVSGNTTPPRTFSGL